MMYVTRGPELSYWLEMDIDSWIFTREMIPRDLITSKIIMTLYVLKH